VSGLVSSSGRGLAWSPDGDRLAFVDTDENLAVLSIDSGNTEIIASPSGIVNSTPALQAAAGRAIFLLDPRWSSDGKYIASVLDLDSGFAAVVLSPDGQIVAVGPVVHHAPPQLIWRSGSNQLFFAEGPVQSPPEEFVSSLWVMESPSWDPRLLLSLPNETMRGLFAPTSSDVILFQSIDYLALSRAQGKGAIPFWWNVVDLASGRLELRDHGSGELMDWH
jgi:hypothetical protein